jgi:hypothetical protein
MTPTLGPNGWWLWDALGALLVQGGVLIEADATMFELLCRAYDDLCLARSDLARYERDGDRPSMRASRRLVAEFRRRVKALCGQCGATVAMIETLERARREDELADRFATKL